MSDSFDLALAMRLSRASRSLAGFVVSAGAQKNRDLRRHQTPRSREGIFATTQRCAAGRLVPVTDFRRGARMWRAAAAGLSGQL